MPAEFSVHPGFSAERVVFGGATTYVFNKQPNYVVSSLATTMLIEMAGQSGTTTRVFLTQGVNPHQIKTVWNTLASTNLLVGMYGS